MPERVGLFGWPVEHSISPAMHNAAFAALGLDWHYELIPIPPDEFAAEVARRLAAGYRGFNVTIPHKQAARALPQVHEIGPAAQAMDAVNTLVVLPGGGLRADNTDAPGFVRDIEQRGVRIAGARCVVLGTGGSARAVVYALEQHGAAAVTQISRNPNGRPGVEGYNALAGLASTADLIVNCTPVGMSPQADRSPWPDGIPFPPGAVLYDLIYNPPVTRLLERARRVGVPAFNGLGMLVWQGALSFAQWTGIMPPVDVMAGAAQQALSLRT